MELNNKELLIYSEYVELIIKSTKKRKRSLSLKKSKSIEGKLVNKADKINSINELRDSSGIIAFVLKTIKLHN
jgi:hypothetical protein